MSAFVIFALIFLASPIMALDDGCVDVPTNATTLLPRMFLIVLAEFAVCYLVGLTDGCDSGYICQSTTGDTGISGDECCLATSSSTSTSTSTATRTTTANTACFDLTNAYGYSDCPARAYLCTDSTYKSLMQTQCPATCGVCGTAVTFNNNVPCFDMTQLGRPSDCPRRGNLCFVNPWVSLMRIQCPMTCGYCSTTTNC